MTLASCWSCQLCDIDKLVAVSALLHWQVVGRVSSVTLTNWLLCQLCDIGKLLVVCQLCDIDKLLFVSAL